MTTDSKQFDIDAFLKNLTERPGVYRMLNTQNTVIYVGKAKNLKKRVSSYFKKNHDEIKTRSMVAQVHAIEVTVTDTEAEALILENTLIKRLKPKYNILFRDDKSYPYIFISTEKKHPALSYHRGVKRKKGRYFGPFPNAGAVHKTLHSLQKIFPVRQCAESVYSHRSRPCLQFQIKRCSGPCVEGFISEEDYQLDVKHTIQFLEGKSFEVIEDLGAKMQSASEALAFELAGQYRDKIAALRTIQSQHLINQPGQQDMDVIALAIEANQVCLTVMMYRGGNLWGSQNHFPKQVGTKVDAQVGAQVSTEDSETLYEALINAFISQHYAEHPIPHTIFLQNPLEESETLEAFLTQQKGFKVSIKYPVKSTAKGLVQLAETNALSGLQQRLTQKASQKERVRALQESLALRVMPNYMECFDISHTQGEMTVGSCVVFSEGVPNTKQYRKFNITDIQPGDDYAAMHQVLTRRYQRMKTESEALPDLIVIDGGKGQLNQAVDVFKNLGLDHVNLVSVAKGEGRKAGLEILYTPHDMEGIDLEHDDIALHLINHIRDEAHRFAITSHRARRQKAQTHSKLEDIPGVGAKTRQKLLMHFGGIQDVKNAAVSELSKVSGVSEKNAQKIYDFFHGDI